MYRYLYLSSVSNLQEMFGIHNILTLILLSMQRTISQWVGKEMIYTGENDYSICFLRCISFDSPSIGRWCWWFAGGSVSVAFTQISSSRIVARCSWDASWTCSSIYNRGVCYTFKVFPVTWIRCRKCMVILYGEMNKGKCCPTRVEQLQWDNYATS